MLNRKPQSLVVGITGASGVVYGVRLVQALLERPLEVHLIVSPDGRKVLAHELGLEGDVTAILRRDYGGGHHPAARLRDHAPESFFAPPASGSFRHDGMAVVPCSMKTLAAVAAGLADNLLNRAADICLKERRPLVLVPRETPLSRIHLGNMLRVSEAGAVVLPPAPGFYHRPQKVSDLVDFVVARILDQLGLPHDLLAPWGSA